MKITCGTRRITASSLNIFIYIVIAGCLDHRKVSITKNHQKELTNLAQHSLLVLDVSVSLVFPPMAKQNYINRLNYSVWTKSLSPSEIMD